MAQVITIAGEKLFATKAQANQQLDIDTFIFANVAGQDPAAAIDRNEGIPAAAIVHQQNVQQTGRINDNVVVYSTVLDSVTGPFEFNWIGLYSSVNQTLVAISHVPTVAKTITAPGNAGNTLNRNFGIEYSGIAELAGISVSPETWQLDFSARLSGMDELTRNLAKDLNGTNSFIDDGFKVEERSTENTFKVLPGVGYVNGLRIELEEEEVLIASSYPKNIYVDAYFDGNASSVWKPKHTLSITSDELTDYIDETGKQHYLVKLATVTAVDEIEDLREPFINNYEGSKISLYSREGEADSMPRILSALSKVNHVHLVGSFTIASNAPSNIIGKLITGVRGVTTLNITSDIDGVAGVTFPLQSSEVRGLSVVGSLPQSDADPDYPNPLSDSYFTDADGALSYADTLTYSCFKLLTNQSKVDNVEVKFITGYGISTNKNNSGASGHALDTGVRNCRLFRNLGALGIEEESEYMKFSNNSIAWNIIGINKRGGNNTFTGNNIDHNRVNYITRSGANNSHGGLTGGTINHGKLAAIIADEITVGESMVGFNMFDSGDLGVYVRNSIGLNISGNFGRTSFYCIGQGVNGSNPGVNKVHNSLFNLHGAEYKVYRNWNESTEEEDAATPDNFIFSNNNLMEGQASRDGSNWDEVIVNDALPVDAQGFISQTTVAGESKSRVVIGRPLDGVQYLGAGLQTGAIKIELPIPSFNNTVFTATIDISTSNAKGARFSFDCYALSGGTWALLTNKGYSGYTYKIRFGEDSGKPVIYIGELSTQFKDAMVSIEDIKLHQGAWAESKRWKRGWVIEQETVAFSNVTQETPDVPSGSDRKDFGGDLNEIDNDNVVYAVSASNTPAGNNGFCTTTVRQTGSAVRAQSFIDINTGVVSTRKTVTGDLGYDAWSS